MTILARLNRPWLHFILLGVLLFYLQGVFFPEPKPVVGPLGEAREEVAISYSGEDVSVGLNARYVLDVLNVIDDEEIVLNLKDEKSSCLITSNGDKDYQSIVMPMRL